MSSICIEKHQIDKGIFHFVGEATENEAISQRFYEMEKFYLIDKREFSSKMRLAIEALVKEEYLKLHPEDYEDFEKKMSDRMNKEKENNSAMKKLSSNIKLFLISRCCEYDSYFESVLRKFAKKRKIYSNSKIGALINDIYKFSNPEHHHGINTKSQYAATEENCRFYMNIFYYFVLAYCEIHYPNAMNYAPLHSLNEDMVLIRDYVPLKKSVRTALQLKQPRRKRYYVQEIDGTIKYYLCCDKENEEEYNREIEVLQKIWADDNDTEPSNIIRFKEEFRLYGGRRKLIFALPSKPCYLSTGILDQMTLMQKEKLFKDATRAIISLHENEPSLYHRDITPDAFILCKTKNSYKLFLSDFDCVKDTDENVKYTVGQRVAEKQEKGKEIKIKFASPEVTEILSMEDKTLVLQSKAWKSINWEKADIYSLGMLGVYIFTGGTDLEELRNINGINDATQNRIIEMCAPIDERPTLV